MSRADLDHIQKQLKLAIQSHQVLVGKMKNDPQNGAIKKQLHELQAEITSLSEKQKFIVQLLRKELVPKQILPSSTSKTLSQPQPRSSLQQPPATTTNSSQPINLSTHHNNNNNNVIKPQHNARKQKPPRHRPRPNELNPQKTHPQSSHSTPLPQKAAEQNYSKPLDANRISLFRDSNLIDAKKLEFMSAIDLITPDALKEIQSRRSERKRRSTANPQFSYGHIEPEQRRVAPYLAPSRTPSTSPPPQMVPSRRRGRPPKRPRAGRPSLVAPPYAAGLSGEGAVPVDDQAADEPGDIHEDFCALCQRSGELLMCDTCSLVYHLACLSPPLTSIPKGLWSCPKCKDEIQKTTSLQQSSQAAQESMNRMNSFLQALKS